MAAHGERPKKQPIFDLNKFMNKAVRVKFAGGREVTGVLKGFDQLMNLVLDDTEETLQDGEKTRKLGLTVLRGTPIALIAPVEGTVEIDNPFVQAEEKPVIQ